MFDNSVVNVAIGLVFCFAAVALAASTLTEALASLVKLRANSLVAGVQKMLNDPRFDGLALKVYHHALVHPQGNGLMPSRSRLWSYDGPSYIRPDNFAVALVDILQQVPGEVGRLKAGIDDIRDPQIRQVLQGMYARTAGDVQQFQKLIAGWFDTAMDRVSGSYKRRAQVTCFLAGLALAAVINIDATHVVGVLWADPVLARHIADEVAPLSSGNTSVKAAVDQLSSLPVGVRLLRACTGEELICFQGHAVTGMNLAGWIITAAGSVFGAPFWFDLLQRLVRLRGAGPRPERPVEG